MSFDSVLFEKNLQSNVCCGDPAGGLTIDSRDSTTLSIEGCTFRRNRKGGGISLRSRHGLLSAAITNSLIVRNLLGALFAESRDDGSLDLAIVNSTIMKNRLHDYNTGCVLVSHFGSGATQVEVRNSIIYKNHRKDLQNFLSASTLNVDHSDVGVLAEGPFNDLGGNVQVDPRANARGHLHETSPVIDAGTCAGAPVTDFEGDPRPTGAGCDIGADEFVP